MVTGTSTTVANLGDRSLSSTEDIVNAVMAKADSNRDGHISAAELERWIRGSVRRSVGQTVPVHPSIQTLHCKGATDDNDSGDGLVLGILYEAGRESPYEGIRLLRVKLSRVLKSKG